MFKLMLAAMSFASFLIWAGVRIYAGIHYDTMIGDYISQAATSPSPPIAVARLDTAIGEIEREGLTSGNTAIFFTYPTNDLGFWYQRLVDSRTILQALPTTDSALEISNTMMRVHESIAGQSKDGDYVLAPAGIEIFPHNIAFFWWCITSLILTMIFGALAVTESL